MGLMDPPLVRAAPRRKRHHRGHHPGTEQRQLYRRRSPQPDQLPPGRGALSGQQGHRRGRVHPAGRHAGRGRGELFGLERPQLRERGPIRRQQPDGQPGGRGRQAVLVQYEHLPSGVYDPHHSVPGHPGLYPAGGYPLLHHLPDLSFKGKPGQADRRKLGDLDLRHLPAERERGPAHPAGRV